MYRTIQIRLGNTLKDYWVHQCQHSNSLINCTQFEVRQAHFDTCPRFECFDADGCYRSRFKSKPVKASYADLCRVMKENPHYKVLGGQCAQQTLQSVVESFRSFNRLLQQYFQGEGDKPRMPSYRKPGGLAPLTFCEEHGIQFTQTEESYTSKTSFLDHDVLPTYGGEKPASWQPSGRRISRGQYKTAEGKLLNADCNGAANILRKVAAQLGIILAESVRAALTLPHRYDLFKSLKKSYRQRCAVQLQLT